MDTLIKMVRQAAAHHNVRKVLNNSKQKLEFPSTDLMWPRKHYNADNIIFCYLAEQTWKLIQHMFYRERTSLNNFRVYDFIILQHLYKSSTKRWSIRLDEAASLEPNWIPLDSQLPKFVRLSSDRRQRMLKELVALIERWWMLLGDRRFAFQRVHAIQGL